MGILHLLLIIVVIGVVVWLINAYVPIPPQFKKLVLIVGIIAAILIVLSAFGVLNLDVGIPKLR